MIFTPKTSGLNASKDTPTLVLLCGFPDISESWLSVSRHFETSHHIIALHFPDFEKEELPKSAFWGYDFDVIVAGLAEVIGPHHKNGSEIHLVGHDWGSYLVQLYSIKFPETVSKLVLLDIGKNDGAIFSRESFVNNILILLYMSWLSTAFIVSRKSSTIALIMIRWYPWKLIGPLPDETDKHLLTSFRKPFMCYPYFQLFSWVIRNPTAAKQVDRYESPFPVQFLFGGKKRTMYHSSSYLDYLESRSDCRYKMFENDGHWLHDTSPDAVAKEMKVFLSE